MFILENFINKSYYDLMIEIDNYNKNNNRKIQIIVAKINTNLKFVKYIYSNDYFYIYLETKDEEIKNYLHQISQLPYESDRRHHTQQYFLDLINDIENSKKMYVTHIFQKK